MPQSKITLIGMENFLNPDHSVFEGLTLPDGIDKETFIGATILRCQEFELLYPNPDFMIDAVRLWGMKNYWTFDRWVKLINKQYDPLFNKDYIEESTDIHGGQYSKTGSGSVSGSDDHTRTDDLQHTEDYTRTDDLQHSEDYTRTDDLKTETDNTETHSEKAYNDADFVATTEDVLDGEVNQSGTQRNAGSGSDTGTQRNAGSGYDTGTQRTAGTFSSQDTKTETGGDSYTDTHTTHGYGNIGVTAAQTLFMKETEVASWNMYEHMADLFASEFCIMIY